MTDKIILSKEDFNYLRQNPDYAKDWLGYGCDSELARTLTSEFVAALGRYKEK